MAHLDTPGAIARRANLAAWALARRSLFTAVVRTSLSPVVTFLGFAISVALVSAGCGGRAIEYVGDGGPGGSSGGSGGGSSSSGSGGSRSSSGGGSSGSSGSSSGVSGSSSGVSGSSSGGGSSGSSSGVSSSSSSGGPVPCSPVPPSGTCDYLGETCDYTFGGGCETESCVCEPGGWACSTGICSPPPPSCPAGPPNPGEACSFDGQSCSYGNNGGQCGGEDCTCENGTWACAGQGCPPPECPPAPPGNGDSCYGIGSICDYPINNNVCSTWECDCYPSGVYSCYETNCGGQDAGSSSDGGFGI